MLGRCPPCGKLSGVFAALSVRRTMQGQATGQAPGLNPTGICRGSQAKPKKTLSASFTLLLLFSAQYFAVPVCLADVLLLRDDQLRFCPGQAPVTLLGRTIMSFPALPFFLKILNLARTFLLMLTRLCSCWDLSALCKTSKKSTCFVLQLL